MNNELIMPVDKPKQPDITKEEKQKEKCKKKRDKKSKNQKRLNTRMIPQEDQKDKQLNKKALHQTPLYSLVLRRVQVL